MPKRWDGATGQQRLDVHGGLVSSAPCGIAWAAPAQHRVGIWNHHAIGGHERVLILSSSTPPRLGTATAPLQEGQDEAPHPTQPRGQSCCQQPEVYGRASRAWPQGRGPPRHISGEPRAAGHPGRARGARASPARVSQTQGTGQGQRDTAPCIPPAQALLPRKGFNYNHVPRKRHGAARLRKSPSTSPCCGDFLPGQKSPELEAKLLSPPAPAPRHRQPPEPGRALGSCAPRPRGCDQTRLGLSSSCQPSWADPKSSPGLTQEAPGG